MGYSLNHKKGITITNAFQKLLNDPARKTCKIWVDKVSKFYNRSMKLWLEDNDIEMYSTHKERKSVAAETFIRTLQICDFNIKNFYVDKLNDIVDKYLSYISIIQQSK